MTRIDNTKTKILAIDPSGTGTTGIFFKGWEEQFRQFTSPEWKEHYLFIFELVEKYQPDLLLFENTNWVSLRGKDMTYLWKLLGAIEILPEGFPWLKTKPIPVNQVKSLRSKLLKGEKQINELEYLNGKGWFLKGEKISVHCLDAYLIYWLEFEKDKPKFSLGQKSKRIKKLWQNY